MAKTKIKTCIFLFLATLFIACSPAPAIAERMTVDACDVPLLPGETCPPDKVSKIEVNQRGNAVKGASRGCEPLPIKFANIMTCPLCPLFKVILETDQVMATKSFDTLAKGFRNLIIVVMALYIAWQTLITVSAFTKQDTAKYLGTLMKQGFKVLVAALLLTNSDWIYDYAINPLMTAGLEFGMGLLGRKLGDYTAGSGDIFSGGVISTDLLNLVMTTIREFNKEAAKLPAIGSSLMCISTHSAAKVLIDFSMFIEGLLVWGFGWAILLAAGFYLLDSVVRFGIFCTLLPFLIAAWPFKVTARYTSTGWSIFMNCIFNFVMMGLVTKITLELITQAMSSGEGGMDELIAAINADYVDRLKDMMDISGTSFLVLIACCLFAFKMIGQINALATEIAGGGGSQSIGGKIGGTAGQAVTRAAQFGGKAGGAVAGFVYEASRAKATVQRGKDAVGRTLGKAGAKLGFGSRANPNGSNNGNGQP